MRTEINFALQAAVDRAKRHGWAVCERGCNRVVLCHRNTAWGVEVSIERYRVTVTRV